MNSIQHLLAASGDFLIAASISVGSLLFFAVAAALFFEALPNRRTQRGS